MGRSGKSGFWRVNIDGSLKERSCSSAGGRLKMVEECGEMCVCGDDGQFVLSKGLRWVYDIYVYIYICVCVRYIYIYVIYVCVCDICVYYT